jgi:hypothetical protein
MLGNRRDVPMTAEQMYDQQVSSLTTIEQFRLATLILIKMSPHSIVDYSEEWSEEDMQDATRHSLQHSDTCADEISYA